jgi:hypothetical protein
LPGVSQKQYLDTINGTPEKRVFLSIIADYDLKTGLCELVDNALDLWRSNGQQPDLSISLTLSVDRQFISVRDNAGGVRQQDIRQLIAPGASGNPPEAPLIGVFGVGGKRAGVALGERVEIRTRYKREKSIQLEITKDWLASDDWPIEIYEIPDIDPGTTTVDISQVRQGFTSADVTNIEKHLGETYSWFIRQGCVIELNDAAIKPILFDMWAYPPNFRPRSTAFEVHPTMDGTVRVALTSGLIRDRNGEEENYGVYVYCNDRLIVKELRTRDVGYFITGEAGVPHPDASLCRALVELHGPAELMPWNSTKNGLNFSDPILRQIRPRIIDFVSYYSSVSRRLKTKWEVEVYPYQTGEMEEVDPTEALSEKKKILPKLPSRRRPSRMEVLKKSNAKALARMPWTIGLVEAMGLVDLISKQNLDTRNRAALILLDSNIEIAFKEFIVSRTDLFPPHKYTNAKIAELLARRTLAIKEVTAYVSIDPAVLSKINFYYALRNSLVHERASVGINDSQIKDYTKTVEIVLKSLFKLKFPR